MTLGESDIGVVKALWEAFGSGGVERMIELTDSDSEWMPYSGEGKVLRGHEDMRAFVAGLEERGARLSATADSYDVVGDSVIVRGRLRIEDFRSVSDASLWWVFRVVAGRVRRAQAFTNRDAAVAAATAP